MVNNKVCLIVDNALKESYIEEGEGYCRNKFKVANTAPKPIPTTTPTLIPNTNNIVFKFDEDIIKIGQEVSSKQN